MQPRERVQAVLRHQPPDRLPRMVNFYPWSFPQCPDREASELFDCEIRFVTADPQHQQASFLHYMESLPGDVYVG